MFLVFLSTVSNVAAYEHSVNYVDLESTVGPVSGLYPGWSIEIIVNQAPANGRWTITGVYPGDSVNISVKCIYENNYNPAVIWPWIDPTGYHWYSIDTIYDSDHTMDNWSIETYAGQSGYYWLYHNVDSVDPNTSIYVSWDIYVENYYEETSGEDDYEGWIDLLP